MLICGFIIFLFVKPTCHVLANLLASAAPLREASFAYAELAARIVP